MSVCPFVRHTPVLCRNGKHYHQTFFAFGSHIILVFFHTERYGNIPTETLNAGYEKKSQFSTNILLYLGNDKEKARSKMNLFDIIT